MKIRRAITIALHLLFPDPAAAELRAQLRKAWSTITLLEGDTASARTAAKQARDELSQIRDLLDGDRCADSALGSAKMAQQLIADLLRERDQARAAQGAQDGEVAALRDALAQIDNALGLYLTPGTAVPDAQWRRRCEVLMSWSAVGKVGSRAG